MINDDIKKNIKLIESVQAPINEAAPMGALKGMSTFFSGMFSDLKAGEFQTGHLANQFYREYMKYLGRIGLKPGDETVEDLFNWLASGGNDINAVKAALTKGFQQDFSKDDTFTTYWNSNIKKNYKAKIGQVFLTLIQQMSKMPEQNLDKEDFDQRGQKNQQTSNAIDSKALPPSPQAVAAPATKAPVKEPPKAPAYDMKDIDDALAQLVGAGK
jgi:hypothetical protein